MFSILILKLLLVPALIVAITLAGRKWGAAVAGCLAGFPVVTGPILFFLAIEQGEQFAAKASIGAIVAVLSNISFGIAYSWVSRNCTWLLSLLAGLAVYFCVVAGLNLLHFSAWQAAGFTVIGLLIATRLYPRDAEQAPLPATQKSDLQYRVAAALALVLGVTIFSAQLGPNLSGLFSVFPVMGSVLGVFSHRNVGQRFAVRLLRGMVQGFFAFTGFCLILALMLPTQPIALSFVIALLAAILLQTVLMRFHLQRLRPSTSG